MPTSRAPATSHTTRAASTTSAPAIAEAGESPLATEARLVAAALRQLRARHDGRGALAMLDAYAARFPDGALAGEGRAARIEALLALGDKAEALALLDRGAATPEHVVLRGELRLGAGRIVDARRDFEAALVGRGDEIEARALYGRAACRVATGEETGARADLEAYVKRFPKGRAAAAARATLAKLSLKGSGAARP